MGKAVEEAIEEAMRFLNPSDDRKEMCRSVVRHAIDEVYTVKPPVDIPAQRARLRAAARALRKADDLVPKWFVAIHDHIGDALANIEWQADRLKVRRSGGPKTKALGAKKVDAKHQSAAAVPLNTQHKLAAAAAAHGLLQAWRGNGAWRQSDYFELTRLLFRAGTGQDPEGPGQGIERQCRNYARFVATGV
jgi:hypothetical protein